MRASSARSALDGEVTKKVQDRHHEDSENDVQSKRVKLVFYNLKKNRGC